MASRVFLPSRGATECAWAQSPPDDAILFVVFSAGFILKEGNLNFTENAMLMYQWSR
jgi:hypothetical protein